MQLERLALILEIVGHKGEATVGDICAHSDLPKPSAYRLVNQLVEAGLLDPIGKGAFAVGVRLKRITEDGQSDQVLLETIAPALVDAAEKHGAAFFFSRLRGQSVEIVHVETPDTGVSFLHPGLGRRPLHACSCSKAVAAYSPAIAATVGNQLKAYTEFTLTDLGDLEAEFARIRARGYAECVEEIERGMCSVAVPLGAADDSPTMSIGATGSVRVFTPAFRRRIGAELLAMADQLSERFAWTSTTPHEASA